MIVVMAHDKDEYTVTIADPDEVTNDARHGISSSRSLEDAVEAAILDFYASGLNTVDLFGDIITGES